MGLLFGRSELPHQTNGGNRYMRKTRLLVGASALSILLAFAGIASAQTPQPQAPAGPQPVRLAGKVGTISASSFILTTPRGDFTINVSASTWIVVEKNGTSVQGALSELQTAKAATVAGMGTADPKVVDAREVVQARLAKVGRAIAPKQTPRERIRAILSHLAASGTIKSINGSTLTITNARSRDVTVNTTAATVVLNSGFQSVGSLKVNDKVQVLGRPDRPAQGATPGAKTPSFTAWALRVDSTGTKLVLAHVESVNGNTFTVRSPADRLGSVTVTVDASTGYRSLSINNGTPSLGSASLADIKVGSNIAVDGAIGSDAHSLAAKAVIILPANR
jgi:hypothetical protein